MGAVVAIGLEMPGLADAVRARGLSWLAQPVGGSAGPAALLLGWRPGDGDPSEGISRWRARGWTGPLLMLLVGDPGAGVARALDAGADDAVLLPACPREVAARAAARLRPARLAIGPLEIDLVERRAARDGTPLNLLPREYRLLLHLARAGGACVSRAELLDAVWGLRFDPGTNVVEVHVSRLRARLDRGFAAPMLVTEKRRGYRLISPA